MLYYSDLTYPESSEYRHNCSVVLFLDELLDVVGLEDFDRKYGKYFEFYQFTKKYYDEWIDKEHCFRFRQELRQRCAVNCGKLGSKLSSFSDKQVLNSFERIGA